jgi:hypothetical protein
MRPSKPTKGDTMHERCVLAPLLVVLAMLAAVPQSRAQQPFVRSQDGFSALFPKPLEF